MRRLTASVTSQETDASPAGRNSHCEWAGCRGPLYPSCFIYTNDFLCKVPASEGRLGFGRRSEEHTSELQSRGHLVCRLLLEKKQERTIVHNRADLTSH